jgi:hypothetical protein
MVAGAILITGAHKSIFWVSILWIADVLGTVFVWRGAPFDSNMSLSFWHFERFRLCYWALCFGLVAIVWLVIQATVERRMDRRTAGVKSKLENVVLGLVAGSLAIGGEVATSVWYWRQLPWEQPGYAGIPYSPYYPSFTDYLWGHLFGWTVALIVCAVVWFAWNQKRRRGQTARTTEYL